MLRKIFSKPLSLSIGEQELSFSSSHELEFALTGRTSLPPSRISALLEASDKTLEKEAEGIKKIELLLTEVVTRSMSDENAVGEFFKDLDLSLISQDNDWRNIINALYGLDASSNDYRRIGLVKYMQYLSSRYQVVQTIYALRQRRKPAEPQAPAGRQPVVPDFSETMLFDVNTFGPPGKGDFGRLPKGEPVDIRLEPNQAITVLLAQHKFRIVCDDDLRLVDEGGRNVALRAGRNIIGRDLSSDIVVDAGYRGVSRKHLIIETEGTGRLRLTDISSLGTSVPHEYLETTKL